MGSVGLSGAGQPRRECVGRTRRRRSLRGFITRRRPGGVASSLFAIIRAIFRRYADLGSVRLLKNELDARGIKSKSWTTASGHCVGDKPFSRGALYLILQNRLYRGEIVDNGQSHPDEHTPIIDQPLWDAVQAQFAANIAERTSGTRTRQASLLAGKLFDGDGNRMTPTHASKEGTRYRYYVSQPSITNDQIDRSAGLRIPAGEIEQAVTSRMRQWLVDPGRLYQTTRLADPSAQRRLIARAGDIGKSWSELPTTRQHAFLTTLIERIEIPRRGRESRLFAWVCGPREAARVSLVSGRGDIAPRDGQRA